MLKSMQSWKKLMLCLLAAVCFFSLTTLSYAEENSEAQEDWSKDWTKDWEWDLQKQIGFQKNPVDLYRGADNSLYITTRPGTSGVMRIFALTQDGKLKWNKQISAKNLESNPFEYVDTQGNVYFRYYTDQSKVAIRKLGPDGKLVAKFALPGTYIRETLSMNKAQLAKVTHYQIAYSDDGSLQVVRADGATGILEFYSLDKNGKVLSQRKVNQSFSNEGMLSIEDKYVVVRQPAYVDVYDLKGTKITRLTLKKKEIVNILGGNEKHLIGQRITLSDKGGYESIQFFGLDLKGKTVWSSKQESLLYNWSGQFLSESGDILKRIDPATGKETALVTLDNIILDYESISQIRYGLSMMLGWRNEGRYQTILLDPSAKSPELVIDNDTGFDALLPRETVNKVWGRNRASVFQQEDNLQLVVWSQFKIAQYSKKTASQ